MALSLSDAAAWAQVCAQLRQLANQLAVATAQPAKIQTQMATVQTAHDALKAKLIAAGAVQADLDAVAT